MSETPEKVSHRDEVRRGCIEDDGSVSEKFIEVSHRGEVYVIANSRGSCAHGLLLPVDGPQRLEWRRLYLCNSYGSLRSAHRDIHAQLFDAPLPYAPSPLPPQWPLPPPPRVPSHVTVVIAGHTLHLPVEQALKLQHKVAVLLWRNLLPRC